jgi:hypothetical protein
MYRGGDARTAQSLHETPPGPTREERAQLALQRVRRLLGDFSPGAFADITWLRGALDLALSDAAAESERHFGLGWLAWWSGEFHQAGPLLSEAARRSREAGSLPAAAEAAYWCARVRIRLGLEDAIADYEKLLRDLRGSPQATAWFVDLLWRTGRVDRAEQVWKSVRANQRVGACPEGPLLEARSLLRRGDLMAVARCLEEASPTAGVVWVERRLLLAWVAVGRQQSDRARAFLDEAQQGPYPASALAIWRRLCEQRLRGEPQEPIDAAAAPLLAPYLRGQEARRSGDRETAVSAYREAAGGSALASFARYGLACLGEDEFASVLGMQPGLFLAVRCRVRVAVERFRCRAMTPAEFLDAVQPATAAGYREASVDHFCRIARFLEDRSVDAVARRQPPQDQGAEAENFRRALLEQVLRRLPPEESVAVLLEWSRAGTPGARSEFHQAVGTELLRSALLTRAARQAVPSGVLQALHRLLPNDPRIALLAGQGTATDHPAGEALTSLELLQAARQLVAEVVDAAWRERVIQLRSKPRWRGLVQALLIQEAAQRGDAGTVATLLEEADPWRCFSNGPPRFVLRALTAIAPRQRGRPAWRDVLVRWLRLWSTMPAGEEGAALAAEAGLPSAATHVPAGTPPAAWFLHQAARAVIRRDFRAALAATRLSVEADPDLVQPNHDSPAGGTVRAALPELERLALAQSLAASLLPRQISETTPAALLVEAIDLLGTSPEGLLVLEALRREDAEAAQAAVADLQMAPGLPAQLAHHFALLERRAALALETCDRLEEAVPHLRLAWWCWLRFMAGGEEGAAEAVRGLLFGHLLTEDRHRIVHLLARDLIDEARRYAAFLQELPAGLPAEAVAVRDDLVKRLARFRDELATEYLLSTREAMRHGHIPEGHRSNYGCGLMLLRRLLSIDRDNVRLLTALVEVCTEWFLDLYHLGDAAGLHEQVERFTPFALQLARLVADCPGHLAARAAVADYWKFRGFVNSDPSERAALYREALRFNPANSNVRDLLAKLGPVGAVEE